MSEEIKPPFGQPEKKNGGAPREPVAQKTIAGMSRRTFALGVGGAAALLGLGSLRFVPSKAILRPPGGQDEKLLISACIRCEKCIESCPRNVLAPTHIEDGILAMRTPTFDFSTDYCDWCNEENGGDPKCVLSCPTRALALPEGSTAHNTIIGKAAITEDWCLAYKLIGCKFCSDACPYDAIDLDDKERPYVIEENCNGCGACEAACVSLKNASISSGANAKAIVVHPETKA